MDRINWDDYFMVLAYWTSRRSPDISTQHGCVIVDQNHRVLSHGFNGYPIASNDALMPKTRPLKYYVTIHAELNSILFSKQSLVGATAYITGHPCSSCLCNLIQVGIKRIVIGNKTSAMIDDDMKKAIDLLLKDRDVEIVCWKPNLDNINKHLDYIKNEIASNNML